MFTAFLILTFLVAGTSLLGAAQQLGDEGWDVADLVMVPGLLFIFLMAFGYMVTGARLEVQ